MKAVWPVSGFQASHVCENPCMYADTHVTQLEGLHRVL